MMDVKMIEMRELSLPRHARARVWTGERFTPGYDPLHVESWTLPAGTARVERERLIGIEAMVPIGGKTCYGLLAIVIEPRSGHEVEVVVPTSGDDGPRWELA